MNPAALAALLTAITGVIAAVTALLHSIQTRKQIPPPVSPPTYSNVTPKI